MYTVSPLNIEQFSLRLLLLHTPGSKSFQELRTVHDHKCAQWQMPKELRQLFVLVLIWSNINNPLQLWNQYKEHLCEDFIHRNSTEVALFLAYQNIN
ncbi:7502_t:CDS:2 [Dentiscutata erythropus]|uniref:7502_t:CDS:1 n=1 Tax=Dentiscutata erythropus TaxID=1348616 RepID=A0A9N9J9C6_9GLOM|nr:7502_t:CDS:2 [Dentiscutata erythropus]